MVVCDRVYLELFSVCSQCIHNYHNKQFLYGAHSKILQCCLQFAMSKSLETTCEDFKVSKYQTSIHSDKNFSMDGRLGTYGYTQGYKYSFLTQLYDGNVTMYNYTLQGLHNATKTCLWHYRGVTFFQHRGGVKQSYSSLHFQPQHPSICACV